MLKRLGNSHKNISSVKFSCYNADEIRQLSFKKVTNPHSLDVLLNPTEGGLYDTAFGAATRDEVCSTCGLGSVQCPGHMGHIELPLPVYNPVFFKTLYYLLRGSCFTCQKLLIPAEKIMLYNVQLDALQSGMVQTVYALKDACNEAKIATSNVKSIDIASLQEIQQQLKIELKKHYFKLRDKNKSNKVRNKDNVENGWSRNALQLHLDIIQEFIHLLAKKRAICPHCSTHVGTIRAEHNSKFYLTEATEKGSKVAASQSYLTQATIKEHITSLWHNEKSILSRIFVAMSDASGEKDVADQDLFGIQDEGDQGKTNAVNVFLLTALPVPPSRFRPLGMVNEMQFESPQTTAYSKILIDCNIIKALMKKMQRGEDVEEFAEIEQDVTAMGKLLKKIKNKQGDLLAGIPGSTLSEKLGNAWNRLQQHVNSLFDSDLDRLAVTNAEKTHGIKQLLEKKDGLFRKHMMGKRVNFAARSVISPDPYIATNEIGVPMVFATRLTYPAPVTPWNIQKLRKAVINGPKVHPGATHVVCDGRSILLSDVDKTQREAVANQLNAESNKFKVFSEPKVVMRHIETGDVMLLNRQPTLHKGSIMAHKVRVLPKEKTLRLHYANCKSYNADFDGDEMNAHFPQTEHCRAEAYNLMLTDKQYLSGKDGKPLSCLIQDHMVAGVNISMRGTFFKRNDYQHLLYNALMHLPFKIKLLKPAILKPQPMWSGKQLFSTLLMNITPDGFPLINLKGTSKIRPKNWQNQASRIPLSGIIEPGDMCESEVIIRNGELLCGVLDKAHYGATEHGLVHATYELYGGEISGRLLTCLARLFTCYLQQYKGFTLGVEDILVTSCANVGRKSVIETTKDNGMATVAKTLNVPNKHHTSVSSWGDAVTDALWSAHVNSLLPSCKGEDKLAAVDHAMKKVSNSVNDQIANWCTGGGLIKTFPLNNLQLMVISGAKGGAVNCMQISCLLGQIELEGRRPPLMPSGRSAPSFKPYDTTLRAGGFISQRFLTGIRPQEYFYHCMAGREGLVDTAVKTSRSGYLQRCLIKHLEGLMLEYDMTVRDSDGGILQFLYGEDGVDINKTSYLQQKQCSLLVDNHKAVEKQLPSLKEVSKYLNCRSSSKKWKKYLKMKKKQEKYLNKYGLECLPRTSGFLEFANEQESGSIAVLSKMWRGLSDDVKQKYTSKATKYALPDPINSFYRPDLYYGATSEKFFEETRDYIKRNPCNLPKDETEKPLVEYNGLTLNKLESLLKMRYQRSLSEPGESVGLLAAQSIGEPSTQMTLNTFHFAGRGEMNVTLGIPRLREILLIASKQIKTPQVTIPVLEGRERRARRLCKELTKVILSQVINKFTVEERLVVTGGAAIGDRYRKCVITLDILPQSDFDKDMALDRTTVLRYIERNFFRFLLAAIGKQMKKRAEEGLVVEQRVAKEASRKTEDKNFDEASEFHDTDMQPLKDDNEKEGGAEEEANDGDADVEKEKRKQEDDVDYEEQDNVDPLEDDQNNYDINNDDVTIADDTLGQVSGDASMMDIIKEEDEDAPENNSSTLDATSIEIRIQAVKNLGFGSITIQDYEFDTVDAGWCKVTLLMPLTDVQVDIVSLVQEQAELRAVRSVPGLTRCILTPSKNDSSLVNFVTEGINFHRMFENEDSLDVNKLYCNCVHSVANMYGIEAARRVVVKEIANVFAVYGIEVDPRHLTLIGDYMCYEGIYKPFNRVAIGSCISPLQQMSFETTMTFLKNAALHGRTDSLNSPSARIVIGRMVRSGTGSFELRYPVDRFIS